MGYFNKDNNKSFQKNNISREMHDAICSDCKKKCQVPFKPTGNKPLRCRDCYKKEDASTGKERRSFTPDRPKQQYTKDYSKQLDAISFKMDKIIKLLQVNQEEKLEGTTLSREREQRKETKQTVDTDILEDTIEKSIEK